MKRSEAVANIKELIEVNLESLNVIPDATLVAELIMYHLEQKGIKPPRNHSHPSDDPRSPVHGWESEDE
jgi:hypothetical protein